MVTTGGRSTGSGGAAARGRAHSAREGRGPDRILLAAVWHAGPALVALALTAIGIAAAETAFPAVLGRALDGALHGRQTIWLIVIAGLVVFIACADALDEVVAASVQARSTAWLRRRLTEHILQVGVPATEHHEAGDLAGRIVGNCGQVGRVAITGLRSIANLLPALGGPIGLALIDPWLCVTFLAGVPLLYRFGRQLGEEVQEVAQQYLSTQGEMAGRLVAALGGVPTAAAAGKLDAEAQRVLEPLPRLHQHGLGLWRAQMRIATRNGLLVSLLEVGVLAVAGVELAAGRITPGQMLAAAQYVLLGSTITTVFSFTAALARSRAAAGRIFEVLQQRPRGHGAEALPAGGGRLEFRGVGLARGGRAVLRGIDLELPAGALVAVVGHSGSGKSLLGALAGRLLDPDEGEVLLDGVPLRELDRAALRRAVGFGFERPALLGETVADAIAFGCEEPPLYRVVEAACDAHADAFIRGMPGRYRTPLQDAPLSGGEAQRLGLARTFAHPARVLILDDVASSLDSVTEHHISRLLLAGPLASRTRIVIARRVSTAAAADLVVWLEAGLVRAVAPHVQLWPLAAYRELFGAVEEAPFARHDRAEAPAWGR
jgi:ATP-binding cassette subfamily B protein